uniref:SH2 domain-containing protein n=1 Tax=Globodera rostochiensis TaxID=31243 RepID=A0A914I5M9_GLORO
MTEESSTLESELEMWQLSYYHGLLRNADFRRLLISNGDFLVRRGHGTSGKERILVLSMNVCSRLRHVIFRQRRGLVAVDFRRESGFETIRSFVHAHLVQADSISDQELVVLKRAIDRNKWTLLPSVLNISEQQPLLVDKLDVSDGDWIDILAWIGRVEVGTKFALINAQFNNWVDIQLTERKWALGELSICRAKDGTGAEVLCSNNGFSCQTLPMPNTPLPGSIIGFRSIIIRYIDQSVITFLRNIRRLFTLGICLELSSLYTEDQSWRIMAQEIWPLLKDGVCTLVNMKKNHFSMMRKYISPTVLFDCANLRRIFSHMLPQCPTDNDSADALPAARDLYAWLHVTRSDNFPAVLALYKWKPKWQPMLDSMTKTFSEACIGVNFIILCTFPFVYDAQFNLVNELTNEQMSLAARSVADGTDAVLTRFPIGIAVDTWAAYANEPLTNYVHIDFGDADIGPLPSSSHPMKGAGAWAAYANVPMANYAHIDFGDAAIGP